jgi:hypothetical protein
MSHVHDERSGEWDSPEEEEDDDYEREEQGEDPTSPMRGFKDLDDLEDHDREADE